MAAAAVDQAAAAAASASDKRLGATTRRTDPDVVIHMDTVKQLQEKQDNQRDNQRFTVLLKEEEKDYQALLQAGFGPETARKMLETARAEKTSTHEGSPERYTKEDDEFDPFEAPEDMVVEVGERHNLANTKTEKIRFSDDYVLTVESIPIPNEKGGTNGSFWGWCLKRVPRGENDCYRNTCILTLIIVMLIWTAWLAYVTYVKSGWW